MTAAIAGGIIALCVLSRYGWLTHRIRTLLETDRLYQKYCLGDEGDPGRRQIRNRLEEKAVVVRRFIREGRIERSRLTYFDSTDRHPYFGAGDVDVLMNFLIPREAIRSQFHVLVAQAVDGYRTQRAGLVNPLAWLRFAAYLPREVLSYLGVYAARTAGIVTLIQIAYWLAIPAGIAWRLGLLERLRG